MKRALRELQNALLILLGVLCAGMGLKGFLLSSNFIDGGVTGISMLLAKTTGLSLSIWLPLVNLPFIAVAYRHMGPAFAARSVLGIAGLAACLALVPFPDVTPDLVLTAVFGGLFIGAGIGLAIRGGAVLDGTEIAALLISKRADLLRVGDVILGFNVVLFLVAMSILGVDAALYSILTYMAAARTLDFILYGIDEYTAITIVSDQHAAIRGADHPGPGPRRHDLRGLRRVEPRRAGYSVLRRDAAGDRPASGRSSGNSTPVRSSSSIRCPASKAG